MENKKKVIQIGVRLEDYQHKMLVNVQEHISACSRGQAPDIAEIVRCLIGWGNQLLVTQEERDYLAGKIPSLSKVEHIPIVGPSEYGEIPVSTTKKSKKVG